MCTMRLKIELRPSTRVACLKEIDTPPEHPRWSVVVPPVAYPDPKPNPYSLILLPGFEEEEYFKLSTEEEDNIQERAAEVEAKKKMD
ncbi:hypothetical protein Acr_15g0013890 [Actinidia rufa]|uniref:Uncharacterized protein n=1 Tax=Actinidia rufa TaxID=165716 RepID=A0A7J0FVQ5_9ERIC|nr:hypothetical protein Acr_15g0013890 [Actinidia rufa]